MALLTIVRHGQASFHSEDYDLESWDAFDKRISGAIDEIMKNHRSGERVALFTSGGPTALAVGRSLGLPADRTLQLIWQIRNTAITELIFTSSRITLQSFNSLP